MNLGFLVIERTYLMIPKKLKKKIAAILKTDNSMVNLGHCHDNTNPCNCFLPFFFFFCLCVCLCVCMCVLFCFKYTIS